MEGLLRQIVDGCRSVVADGGDDGMIVVGQRDVLIGC